MATTPFIEREDYDRFLEQEASHFPRATKEAVARLITSSLPDEVQWVADSAWINRPECWCTKATYLFWGVKYVSWSLDLAKLLKLVVLIPSRFAKR